MVGGRRPAARAAATEESCFAATNQLKLPAAIRVRVSPWRRYDLGLEFKLLDLKKDKLNSRFLSTFVQARF